MKKFQILLAMSLCTIMLHAQTVECGTAFNPNEYNNYVRSHHQRVYANGVRNNDVLYFPIQYHIIRNSSGNMALPASETQVMTNILNNAYKNANIQFYSCSNVEVITNNNYFELDKSLESGLSVYDSPNAINVYVCNTINGGTIAGFSHYPWSGVNRIVFAKDYAKLSTVPHEFGHYFGLLHTHETYYGRELIDGSNCATAGDKLCDTPADPGLSDNTVDCNCIYIGNQYLNGLPYSPSTRNFMSYSRKSCRTEFTIDQIDVVRSYANGERNYLINTRLISNKVITANEQYCNDIVIIENSKIKSGGSLVIDYCKFTTIEGPFEVESGAHLEIK